MAKKFKKLQDELSNLKVELSTVEISRALIEKVKVEWEKQNSKIISLNPKKDSILKFLSEHRLSKSEKMQLDILELELQISLIKIYLKHHHKTHLKS